jgi:hypothetical protein
MTGFFCRPERSEGPHGVSSRTALAFASRAQWDPSLRSGRQKESRSCANDASSVNRGSLNSHRDAGTCCGSPAGGFRAPKGWPARFFEWNSGETRDSADEMPMPSGFSRVSWPETRATRGPWPSSRPVIFFEGRVSWIPGLIGLRCRFHRHLPRPTPVDGFGRHPKGMQFFTHRVENFETPRPSMPLPSASKRSHGGLRPCDP